jgi:LysM repeat protein
MVYSPLVNQILAPNGKWSSRGGSRVTRIIFHHWAGTGGGIERLVYSADQASANLILLNNGHLIGSVPEEYRAWTSGSFENDRNSITVEIQNLSVVGWTISDASLEKSAQIVADVARRYGWSKIDRSNVIGHREVWATECPGPYFFARLGWIVDRANQIWRGSAAPAAPAPAPAPAAGSKYVPDPHWRVDPGDNLTMAANHFGVSVDRIAAYNGIKNKNAIKVGERIWPPVGFDTWVVDPGDTLSSIVAWYHKNGHKALTVQKLQFANGINNPSTETKVGLRLQIPR